MALSDWIILDCIVIIVGLIIDLNQQSCTQIILLLKNLKIMSDTHLKINFVQQSRFINRALETFCCDMKEILNVQEKLFSDLYLAQFLDFSVKVFLMCEVI